jgi:hypothetical protein
MNYKIVIIDEAKEDYKTSLNWYKNINKQLGIKFNESFKECLSRIRNNPLLFQNRYDNTRVIVFKSFPYLIHYTIYQNIVVIKQICHSSQDSDLNIY